MIEFLFLLVEILAIVYLIHNIVGVSVKVDVYLIMLLAIGLGITIAIINDLIWDKGVCIVYGLLGLYVVVELKNKTVCKTVTRHNATPQIHIASTILLNS